MADRVTVDLSQFSEDTIDKAFWLQEHIRRHGIDGIHYMWHARTEARLNGPREIANNITHELQRL